MPKFDCSIAQNVQALSALLATESVVQVRGTRDEVAGPGQVVRIDPINTHLKRGG